MSWIILQGIDHTLVERIDFEPVRPTVTTFNLVVQLAAATPAISHAPRGHRKQRSTMLITAV